jgi:polyhydroxyalkanoate synthesis regulator phasin
MTLEERVTALEKAVTCIENKNQEDVTAFVDKIIQEMRQSSVFSRLLEKPRGD